MSSIDVSIKGLDELTDCLRKAGKNPEMFFEHCAKELAVVLLRRTMQKTPRDTSNLVRRWTDHESSQDSKAKDVTAEQWAEDAKIDRKGNYYEITISNPTEYAPYVEYGHRTHKADGTEGWVPGQFMLTMSVSELDRMKNGLLEKYLNDYLKELFD